METEGMLHVGRFLANLLASAHSGWVNEWPHVNSSLSLVLPLNLPPDERIHRSKHFCFTNNHFS